MKVYKFQISGEYPSHPSHPDEDYATYKGNCFAVFDGVTLLHQKPYPNPSPAAEAARLACEVIVNFKFNARHAENLLRQAAKEANLAIRHLNESLDITKKTIDYLVKQHAAAVGAYGFIEDGMIHGAQINDSEIAVLDSAGNIKFRLETSNGPIGKLLEARQAAGEFKMGSPDEQRFTRRNIINNPNLEFDGKPIRAGVLTGQDVALEFLNIGSAALESGDTVLFYSDGMIPYIENSAFREYLADSNDFSHFNTRQESVDAPRQERSIIIVKEPV